MDDSDVMLISREALILTLEIGLPVMMVALIVGLIISLFQALTQIQEMTLTFVPKIIAIFVALLLLAPFMFSRLAGFMESIADRIVAMGG